MRCKKIRELLSADYLDHEVNQKTRQDIERHLASCPHCRSLAVRLQAQRRLLQENKLEPAPDRVWLNIRDSIITQRFNEKEKARRGIPEWLKDKYWKRKPVFALASTLTVILFILVFAGVFIQKKQSADNIKSAEIYGLGNKNGGFIYSLGTPIEDYFL